MDEMMNGASKQYTFLERVTAEHLFEEFSYVDIPDLRRGIQQRCLELGYLAFFDFDGRHWVFHTLMHPKTQMKWERPNAAQFAPAKGIKPEQRIEDALCALLIERGFQVQRQVRCECGIADVVTEKAIFEVKADFTPDSIFAAVGQVLLYRQAIDPRLIPCIVGVPLPDYEPHLALVFRLGVRVIRWKK